MTLVKPLTSALSSPTGPSPQPLTRLTSRVEANREASRRLRQGVNSHSRATKTPGAMDRKDPETSHHHALTDVLVEEEVLTEAEAGVNRPIFVTPVLRRNPKEAKAREVARALTIGVVASSDNSCTPSTTPSNTYD